MIGMNYAHNDEDDGYDDDDHDDDDDDGPSMICTISAYCVWRSI